MLISIVIAMKIFTVLQYQAQVSSYIVIEENLKLNGG